MLKSIPPFCRALIIALGVISLLGLLMSGIVGPLVLLSHDSVFERLYVWTLVTYPFLSSLWGAAITGLVIWSFGSELEQIIHTGKFALMMGLSIILCGVTFLILERNAPLYGPEFIGVFIVTGFAYMWPQREVSVMGMFWIKAWVIALVYFAVAFIPKMGTQLDFSPSQILAPVFAAVSALILFHLNYRQHSMPFNIGKNTFAKKQAKQEEVNDPSAVNRRIDEILDKIASKGMNSLSQEEKDFLLKHSK